MRVTDVQLKKENTSGSCLATGEVTLDDAFTICGIQILESTDGILFVAFPSRKNSEGEYKELCYPSNINLREDITVAVLSEFERF